MAAKAASRNGIDTRLTCSREEGFAALERLASEKQRFGLVVADPPSFVKSKRELKSGLKGYRKLARAASSLVREEGCLVIASCSHNVPVDLFRDEVRKGWAMPAEAGAFYSSPAPVRTIRAIPCCRSQPI